MIDPSEQSPRIEKQPEPPADPLRAEVERRMAEAPIQGLHQKHIWRDSAVSVTLEMVREETEAIVRIIERRASRAGVRGHNARHPNGQKERTRTPAGRRLKAVELALRQVVKEIRDARCAPAPKENDHV
jgi:hypothetical protein